MTIQLSEIQAERILSNLQQNLTISRFNTFKSNRPLLDAKTELVLLLLAMFKETYDFSLGDGIKQRLALTEFFQLVNDAVISSNPVDSGDLTNSHLPGSASSSTASGPAAPMTEELSPEDFWTMVALTLEPIVHTSETAHKDGYYRSVSGSEHKYEAFLFRFILQSQLFGFNFTDAASAYPKETFSGSSLTSGKSKKVSFEKYQDPRKDFNSEENQGLITNWLSHISALTNSLAQRLQAKEELKLLWRKVFQNIVRLTKSDKKNDVIYAYFLTYIITFRADNGDGKSVSRLSLLLPSANPMIKSQTKIKNSALLDQLTTLMDGVYGMLKAPLALTKSDSVAAASVPVNPALTEAELAPVIPTVTEAESAPATSSPVLTLNTLSTAIPALMTGEADSTASTTDSAASSTRKESSYSADWQAYRKWVEQLPKTSSDPADNEYASHLSSLWAKHLASQVELPASSDSDGANKSSQRTQSHRTRDLDSTRDVTELLIPDDGGSQPEPKSSFWCCLFSCGDDESDCCDEQSEETNALLQDMTRGYDSTKSGIN